MTRTALADDSTLIVGAGYVGQQVLTQLPDGAAIGLSRSPPGTDSPIAAFDFDTHAALPVTLPDRYTVLYTVAPSDAPSDAADNDIRLEKLLQLLQPAPQRFVYISTTGVYGDHAGGIVTENTPPQPKTNRAKRRLANTAWVSSSCAYPEFTVRAE